MNPSPEQQKARSKRTRRTLAGMALAAAITAGGAGAVSALGFPSTTTDPATTQPSTPGQAAGDQATEDQATRSSTAPKVDTNTDADTNTDPNAGSTDAPDPADRPARPDNGETEVTGADADSASAAALAEVPGGTVKHVTTDTDDGGAFEVHMTDADGNRVKVILDANFAVIETLTGGPGGPGGQGGHADNGETEVTGADADSASAAALAEVPGGSVKRVTTDTDDADTDDDDTDDGGAFEVHMTDADGNRVKVILDANFAVIETLTGGPGGQGGPGGRGGRPDDASSGDSTGTDAPNVVDSANSSTAA